MPAQKLQDRYSLKTIKMDSTLPSNPSTQGLVDQADDDSGIAPAAVKISDDGMDSAIEVNARSRITCRQLITVIVLCYVNLINYMDRYTIAGILPDILSHYGVNEGAGGLLQTAFIISYMLFAPLFGYLGDRYSRKAIMALGVFLWGLTTLIGSFMNTYELFLVCRLFVGIGEASYSTIAPTIISDLFAKDMRSKMLACFYFAIPVGSGLGYITGSETAKLANAWQWGLRVTPALGALAVLLIVFVMVDPPRGHSESAHTLTATSWTADIKALLKNKSFMYSTLGFTGVSYVAGALAWWTPTYIYYGIQVQGQSDVAMSDVAYIFGILTMISGIIGVPLGSYLSQKLKPKYPRCDPMICATGMLVSMPCFYFAAVIASTNTPLCYAAAFLGMVAINLNWSIVADMLLYVVIPTRRSTAEAFQILIAHLFGDAGSPYIVGQISGWVGDTMSSYAPEVVKYTSLQYALFTTNFVDVIGGFFFFVTAWYIIDDKLKADRSISGDGLINENAPQPTNLYADDAGAAENSRTVTST